MDAVKSGALGGRAMEEALLSYQQIWDQVQSLEKEARRIFSRLSKRFDTIARLSRTSSRACRKRCTPTSIWVGSFCSKRWSA